MNLEEQIPSRSSAALGALDVFYAKLNEVDFYIEDTEQENLYFSILKKHFPAINFSKIFPLGGKPNVLAHAKNPINKKRKSKKVYIVDGDFDHLSGSIEIIKNVFYLDRYCIENYLIEVEAIIEVVIENNPRLKPPEIALNLGLVEFLGQIEPGLKELFILFYSAQLFQLGIKNCASKPEEFCEARKPWKISDARIAEYRNLVLRTAVPPKADPALIDPSTDVRLQTVRAAKAEHLIGGKFMLAMIFHYVKSKYSLGSITFDSFVYRVAKNSTLDSLIPVAREIQSHITPMRKPAKRAPVII